MLDKSFNDQDAHIKGRRTLYSQWVDNSSCSPTVVFYSLHLVVRNMSAFWFRKHEMNYFKFIFQHKSHTLGSFSIRWYNTLLCIYSNSYSWVPWNDGYTCIIAVVYNTYHGVPSAYDCCLPPPKLFSTMLVIGRLQLAADSGATYRCRICVECIDLTSPLITGLPLESMKFNCKAMVLFQN